MFSKRDQIRRKMRILSHLLSKSLMENFIFCAVIVSRIEKIPAVSVIISIIVLAISVFETILKWLWKYYGTISNPMKNTCWKSPNVMIHSPHSFQGKCVSLCIKDHKLLISQQVCTTSQKHVKFWSGVCVLLGRYEESHYGNSRRVWIANSYNKVATQPTSHKKRSNLQILSGIRKET